MRTLIGFISLLTLLSCNAPTPATKSSTTTQNKTTAASGDSTASGTTQTVDHTPTHFVYATNLADDSISEYGIDPVTGYLTALSGTPVAFTGSQPADIKVHPSHKFAYVAAGNATQVYGYSIDGTSGALTSFSGGSGNGTSAGTKAITFDATGNFLFAQVYSGSTPTTILKYSVNTTTGVLQYQASYAPSYAAANGLTFDNSGYYQQGAYAYLVNPSAHTVDTYQVTPLVKQSAIASGNSPTGLGGF